VSSLAQSEGFDLKLTRITSDSGRLTKQITLHPDGSLGKTPGVMSTGKAERVNVKNFAELHKVVSALDSNQAVVHSHFRHNKDVVKVLPKDTLNGQADTISRTKEFFYFETGPSPISFDYDRPQLMGADDWLAKMVEVWPGFDGAGYVHLPSSSGSLTKSNGDPLPDSTGIRFLFGIKDATDTRRFSDVMFARCWLAGLGYIQHAVTGEPLLRTIFDKAVHQPQALDYLADPILQSGLTQKRNISWHEGHLLDTRSFPDLSTDEKLEVVRLQKLAVQLVSDTSAKIKYEYIEERGKLLAKTKKIDIETAERTIREGLDHVLLPYQTLTFDKFGDVSVLDILIDPRKYHEATLADPLEPETGKNKAKCWLNPDQGEVRIFSNLHGNKDHQYICVFDFEALKTYYERLPDEDPQLFKFLALIQRSELSPVERDRFFVLIKKRTGLTLPSIREEIDQEQRRALTHDQMANKYIENKLALKFADGGLWELDDRAIWNKLPDNTAQAEVGRMFDDEPLCRTQAQYAQIVRQIQNNANDPNFFATAPIGIACPNGFHQFTADNELECVPLKSSHRQRFFLPNNPSDDDPLQWNDFLYDCFAEPDSPPAGAIYDYENQVALLQEIFGAVLFGFACELETGFFALGESNSGKSTALRVLESLLPDEFICAVPPSRWGDPYHSAARAGMRLISVGETEQDILGADFKSYIGRDLQNARHPTGRPFKFRPSAGCVFNANDFPPLKDRSQAIWRRITCLGFFNSRVLPGAEQDINPSLDGDLIEDEKAEIIGWAMRGAQRVRARWDDQVKLTQTTVGKHLVEQWKDDADTVRAFLSSDSVCTHVGTREAASAVYRHYRFWAQHSGYHPLSAKKFHRDMQRLGHHRIKSVGIDQYEEIRIVEDKSGGSGG